MAGFCSRFVVRGERTENRKVTTVWLTYVLPEGVYQWSINFDTAYPFASENEAILCAKACSGPWYNIPDLETLKVLAVRYTPPQSSKIELEPC